MVRAIGYTLGMVAAISLPAVARAQRPTFQLSPYVWAAGIGGTLRPVAGAPTVSFRESFREVLADLDGAFFLSGAADFGTLKFVGDFSTSTVSKRGLAPPGIPADGRLRQSSLSLLAGGTVARSPRVELDVFIGARTWAVKSRASVPSAGVSTSPESRFTDTLLAARARYRFDDRWSATGYFDYGIFRTGSRATSQLVLVGNYGLNDRTQISFGYRQLSVDYRRGGTTVDATLAGFLLGLTFRL